MYIKYSKLVRNRHVLHAIRSGAIPCVRKIHAINSKNNQNLILRNRPSFLYNNRPQIREFSLIFRGIRGLLKLRYVLLGSAVGGGYQVKKVNRIIVTIDFSLSLAFTSVSYFNLNYNSFYFPLEPPLEI